MPGLAGELGAGAPPGAGGGAGRGGAQGLAGRLGAGGAAGDPGAAGEAAAWALAGAPGAAPGELRDVAQAAWAGAQAAGGSGGLQGPGAAAWLHLLGALGAAPDVPQAQREACRGAVLVGGAKVTARRGAWVSGAPETLSALCYVASAVGDGGLPAVTDAVVAALGAAEAGEQGSADRPANAPSAGRLFRLEITCRAFSALAEGRLDGLEGCPTLTGLTGLAGALLEAALRASPTWDALLLSAAGGLACGLKRRTAGDTSGVRVGIAALLARLCALAEGRLTEGALVANRRDGVCAALGLALCHIFEPPPGGPDGRKGSVPGPLLPPKLVPGFLSWFIWQILTPEDLFEALPGLATPAGGGDGQVGADWWLSQHVRAGGPLHVILRTAAPVCASVFSALPAVALSFPLQQLHLLARRVAASYDAHRVALAALDQQALAQFFGQVYFLVVAQLDLSLKSMSAAGGDPTGGAALAGVLDTLALLEFCKVSGLRAASRTLHSCFVLLESCGPWGYTCVLHALPRLDPDRIRSPGPAADSRLLFLLKLTPLLAGRAEATAFRAGAIPVVRGGMRHPESQVCAAASEAAGLILAVKAFANPDAEALFRDFLEAARSNFPDRLPLPLLAQGLGAYLGRADATRGGINLFCSELLRMCTALEAEGDGAGSGAVRRILLESLAVVDVRQMGLVMEAVGAFIAAARGGRRERYLDEVIGWIPSVVDYVRKPFIVDWYQRLAAVS